MLVSRNKLRDMKADLDDADRLIAFLSGELKREKAAAHFWMQKYGEVSKKMEESDGQG